MFSIRTAIWIILVIFLLPTDEAGKQELYKKASTAANYAYITADYVGGVCSKVDLCANFDPSWNTFSRKARTGVDLIAELIENRDELRTPRRGSFSRLSSMPARQAHEPRRNIAKNTLEISDLIPVWHGPERHTYASR